MLELCGAQLIMGFGGVVGINQAAVIQTAERLGLQVDDLFLQKFRIWEVALVSGAHEKKE